MPTNSIPASEVKQTYRDITQRMSDACVRAGRKPDDCILVAVTKYAMPDQMRALLELGHRDLGESRAQQLQQRAAQMDEFLQRRHSLGHAVDRDDAHVPDKVRWHMIGHLQRNKIKQVAPLVDLIHSVDSLRLAEDLHAFGLRTDTVIDVLLQVNTAQEEGKYGCVPAAAIHLAEQIDSMVHLRLRGLMAMAPYSDNPEDARDTFARTADLFRDIRKAGYGEEHFTVLSMGMSHDFEVAIEEGANVIRIGSALFGESDPDNDDE